MWDVWEDFTIGSDHFLIYCKIGLDVNEIVENKISTWKFKSANWEAFKYISDVRLQKLSLNEGMKDVEGFNEKLCKILFNTAEVIRKSKVTKRKKSVPWWPD